MLIGVRFLLYKRNYVKKEDFFVNIIKAECKYFVGLTTRKLVSKWTVRQKVIKKT